MPSMIPPPVLLPRAMKTMAAAKHTKARNPAQPWPFLLSSISALMILSSRSATRTVWDSCTRMMRSAAPGTISS